jgi:hypothetical protein
VSGSGPTAVWDRINTISAIVGWVASGLCYWSTQKFLKIRGGMIYATRDENNLSIAASGLLAIELNKSNCWVGPNVVWDRIKMIYWVSCKQIYMHPWMKKITPFLGFRRAATKHSYKLDQSRENNTVRRWLGRESHTWLHNHEAMHSTICTIKLPQDQTNWE